MRSKKQTNQIFEKQLQYLNFRVQQIKDPIQERNKLGLSICSLMKKIILVKVQEFLKWKVDLFIFR